MNGTAELRTERLLLRRYRADDAAVLYEKFGCDPKMYEYSGWNPYATQEMAAEMVADFIACYTKPDFYGWALEYEGKLIGTVGAYDYDAQSNQIEMGMSIERDSWGKGFATEALSCVLPYLKEHEKIGRVTAWCASDNAGSMKAMLKAGMKQTGTEKDALEVDGKLYDRLTFCF